MRIPAQSYCFEQIYIGTKSGQGRLYGWRAAGRLDEARRSDPAIWSELVSLDRDQPDLADVALITARLEGLERLAAQGVRIITFTPGGTPSAVDQVSSIDELASLLFGSDEGG